MKKYLGKLVSIGGAPLGNPSEISLDSFSCTKILLELRELLSMKNGFFAFESALRVFPASNSDDSYSLLDWNSESLWRFEYQGLTADCVFFAEDVFGCQFAILNSAIFLFDPETAELSLFAGSLEEWARKILADFDRHTGYSFARDWQLSQGKLGSRQRLVPKIPFVCGGSYVLSNMTEMEAALGMRYRASIAMQIKDLPDGSSIEFNVID